MSSGELWRRLRFVFKSDHFERELEEGMRLHAKLRARRLCDCEVPGEEAADRARGRFGNRMRLLEDGRSVWSFAWIESLDKKFATPYEASACASVRFLCRPWLLREFALSFGDRRMGQFVGRSFRRVPD
ncbi:MAG: hypothetical protein ACRD8O_13585 [Bryobacteraceae bacterium]